MKKFISIILVVAGLAGVAYGGWYFYNQKVNNNTTENNQTQTSPSAQVNSTQEDPSENGKYLVIKEWGVRFVAPDALKGKVVYEKSGDITDADNITFQTVKLFVPQSLNTGEECNARSINGDSYLDTNVMTLRVPKNADFNTARYKGSIKKIYNDNTYTYYVNYLEPVCANSALGDLTNSLERSVEASLQKS